MVKEIENCETNGDRARPAVVLGETCITSGAAASLIWPDVLSAIKRHAAGDWGDVCADDRAANESALQTGHRLLSVYRDTGGTKFWIITEWDRSATTVLLPEEY